MAKFDVDVGGVTYEVDAPNEETAWLWANQTHSQSNILPNVSNFEKPQSPLPIGKEGFPDALKAELQANPVGASLAAAGTALSDLYQGGKQLIGMGDPEAIKANEIIKQESPISTVLGNAALYGAAGAAAPVLNTLPGAVATGAVSGALMPTDDPNVIRGKVTNAAFGAGAGGVGVGLAKGVGNYVGNKRALAEALKSQNAGRDATIQASREAGYVIPPSATNPNFINTTMESLAGKAATQQEASLRNQEVTNALARKALGLADDASLSDDVLAGLRKESGKAYADVASLDNVAPDALEMLKNARFQANAYMKHYNRSADPASLAQAKQFKEQAANIEKTLEDAAHFYGKPDLIDALKKSRTNIAKSYTVERALNDATGDVNARNIGRAFENDAPLSGELETIGKFASGFPKYNQTPQTIGSPGVSKLKFALGTLLGTGGAAGGGPIGAAAGALPFVAPDLAKSLILSKPYQAMMANPSYGVGPSKRLAEAILASRYSPMAVTGAAMPALTE